MKYDYKLLLYRNYNYSNIVYILSNIVFYYIGLMFLLIRIKKGLCNFIFDIFVNKQLLNCL